MTDITDKPTTREEAIVSEALGKPTLIKRSARRLPWFTDSTGIVQKAFEFAVAACFVAVLFWACVSFAVVARQVMVEDSQRNELLDEADSLRAELRETREMCL